MSSTGIPSEALAEILAPLETGMRCVVVHSETEAEDVFVAMEAEGYRCAAISTTGLPHGGNRLTFLPKSAFRDPPEDADPSTGPVLQDGVEHDTRGPPVSRQPQRPIQDWIDDIDAVRKVRYDSRHIHTGLPPLVSIEAELITTLRRGSEEVDYFDLGVAEHYPPREGSEEPRGGVRARIQTRQRIYGGDVFGARAEALRRSVDFAAGCLIRHDGRDAGNGD